MVGCNTPTPCISYTYPLLKTTSMHQALNYNYTCINNCSGHGDCYDGICLCEVQYSGGNCTDPNLSYFIAFSTIFYIISVVSFIQLLLCIKAEFGRMKTPSVLRACRVTTQKALYLLVGIATAIRGFYFSSPEIAALQWASSLMSAYYPVLLTGSSLIVCFWAEVFHVRDLCLDNPRFLTKSFLGFITFNVITYSLLLTELLLLQFTDSTDNDKSLFTSVFNGCYALLMLIVIGFFLFYGVEVFFKVRGGFIHNPSAPTNSSQLHQSRFGLLSQAFLLIITVGFIVSDVLGSCWKDKVPVFSRNFHHVLFRVVEMGVALWFPCVLWNCVRPEQLWILNPRKILERLEGDRRPHPGEAENLVCIPKNNITKLESNVVGEKTLECWICYDTDRIDAGPLIQPCHCKGDVSFVHHDCLKMWLVESSGTPENMKCKVCNEQYELERGYVWLPNGFSATHWVQTASIITAMCTSIGGACLVVKIISNVGIRTLAVGFALLVQYICLRLLGISILTAYHRAKFSAVKIMGRKSMDHGRLVEKNGAEQSEHIATLQDYLINDSNKDIM